MSGRHEQPFDARRFLIVFLGRGGLGLGLAMLGALILLGLGWVGGGGIAASVLLGGAAVLIAFVVVLLVTRRQLQHAVEAIAEAAIDELI